LQLLVLFPAKVELQHNFLKFCVVYAALGTEWHCPLLYLFDPEEFLGGKTINLYGQRPGVSLYKTTCSGDQMYATLT
jgi:hypothetical protein